MIMLRRSAPIITLSLANSKSRLSSRSLLVRAASRAASLTRFSRSAPEKGGVLLALREQVARPAGADADEHLDEVRTADAEEGDPRLAGDGAREQRLAGARRAHQQYALGDAAAQLGELLRILEELDDLLQL